MTECQQKYQKVYSFLKRTLTQERYEGIRVIDPCVIVADGFNKSFMFAILGDNMLYITENPPRLPKDIRITVDLSTVTSVELIHDIPEFLGGDLKTQTQHIIVTYKTVSPQKSQTKPTRDLPSPRQALQTPLLTASALLQLNLDSEHDDTTESSSSHYYHTERITRKEENYAKKLYKTSKVMSVSEGNIPQLIEQERIQGSLSTERHNTLSVPSSSRPLPLPHMYLGHSINPSSNMKQQHRKSRKKHDSESRELNSSSSSNELDFSQVRHSSRDDYSDVSDRQHSDRRSYLDLPRSSRGKMSWQTSRAKSVDETHSAFLPREEDSPDGIHETEDSCQIHMYILEQGSPMFAFMKSTWNNCIVKSTLSYGDDSSQACSSPRSSKVDNSQLLTLFNQLKAEILDSHRMEKTFVLINELLTAAQKSFSLRKFFWKSPELFQFIVVQIKLYLPHSPSMSSKRKGNNRSDEFDFVVVLLDCLVSMFRETEILPSRLNVLKANKGQALKDLLDCILCTPTITHQKPEPPKMSPAAQLLLMGTNQDTHHSSREDETSELIKEITDCVTGLLYEIVAAVHQAIIFPVEGNALNIYWLVNLLDSNAFTESFVERMMERQMAIISSRKKKLSPKHAVLLYRQLYVLQNIMDYSEHMAASIPRSYAEEFRYYIKKPIIQKKLSSRYPLTPPILKLLDRVTSRVLKGKPRGGYR